MSYRGRGRTAILHSYVTEGWGEDAGAQCSIQMESTFSNKAYSERSRAYAADLLRKVGKEVAARSLPDGKSKYVFFFCDPLFSKCVDLANKTIRLRGSTEAPLTKDKMYLFLAVLFFFHSTRLSTRKRPRCFMLQAWQFPRLMKFTTCKRICSSIRPGNEGTGWTILVHGEAFVM